MLVVTFSVVFGLNWNLYSYMIGNDCRVVFNHEKQRNRHPPTRTVEDEFFENDDVSCRLKKIDITCCC